ncbi:helix-turn-helix domain-containing protein [Lentzea sp. NPDC003310]|uniref:TetR/AcrR family transcriptional regulator n=1 Tax=Lentzea sp. NPDC003310 TaxID=3154447 RepID=UPI0033B5F62D
MPDDPGRRERKKQATRQALVAAAVRLFADRDYDEVSVADIAEAADVSKRTFFLHFPTKEDVLLADGAGRAALAVRAVEERAPGAPLSETLAAAADRMITSAEADLPTGLAALRARLVVTSPAVQARVLHTTFAAQTRITAAVRDAYDLDDVTAAALVGALMGAISAATITSLERGDTPEETLAAMRTATSVALRCAVTPGS